MIVLTLLIRIRELRLSMPFESHGVGFFVLTLLIRIRELRHQFISAIFATGAIVLTRLIRIREFLPSAVGTDREG
jgi:hypothetical protein